MTFMMIPLSGCDADLVSDLLVTLTKSKDFGRPSNLSHSPELSDDVVFDIQEANIGNTA